MTFNDAHRIQELVLGGAITTFEADCMQRRGSMAREIADMMLCEASMPPIGEGAIANVLARFESYAAVLQRESEESVIGDLDVAVGAALRQALQGYTIDHGKDRIYRLLHTLGAGAVTDREAALIVHTRVMASQIRDEITHPYTGALAMGWPDLKPQDNLDRPEVKAILESRRLERRWISSGSRKAVETAITDLASSLGWPS
jgi:hypothetical protein